MYGAWCFGDISRTADTLVLYKTVWGEHVCTVNVWDWLTGPLEREKKKKFLGFFFSFFFWEEELDWWKVRGWCQCCCGLNGFLGETVPLVFPPVAVWGWGRMEVPACPVWHPDWGGSMKLLRPWVRPQREGGCVCWSVTQEPKLLPPLGHCMTGAFFGVFGAATKCAMCYVAWFIIFLQATKLICSPIV